jgi:hypothetical protein
MQSAQFRRERGPVESGNETPCAAIAGKNVYQEFVSKMPPSKKSESNPVFIPFSITPDAEDYLRNRLSEMPPNSHPVLMMTMRQTDGLKPPRWHYEGQSFVMVYFDDAEKLEVTELELFGRPIAIESNTMKQLSGRTLDLRRVASNRGLMNDSRFVLVVDSAPSPSSPRFETSVSPEQAKRVLSIAAFTFLGGFTGIGVTWIVSAMVLNIMKIPFERLLPMAIPLFITGWIVGAIASFLFFRSAIKTSGGTEFAQEQRQSKYVRRLDAEMNWWIFLGIPVPLTGILIFFIEPFAHSVGDKTGFAVGAIMVMFALSMYFCDRLPQRLVVCFGILGWVLSFALGYWFFKTHGP